MSKFSVTFIYLLFLRWSSPSPLVGVYNTTIHDGANESAEFYVVGGFRPPYTNSLARYVISLRAFSPKLSFGDNHYCGGTIIAPGIILTAAHCLVYYRGNLRPKDLTVVAGSTHRCSRTVNTQEVGVRSIVRHEKYRASSESFDIGLLKLKGTLKIDDNTVAVMPVAIKTPAPGTNCTVAGWGRLYELGPYPEKIVHSIVTVVSFDYCKKMFNQLTDGMLCAAQISYESDACTGDSGGPLICNGEVAGIVSFGKGCAMQGYPGVYTDVAYYKDWIWRNCAPHCLLDVPMLVFLLAVNWYCLFK